MKTNIFFKEYAIVPFWVWQENFFSCNFADEKSCYSDFSFCKDMFEKYGVLRQFRSGEYFVHSGDVMEYVGWLVSGGFKYSLTASNGIDKTIGFALADSILINYVSVMHSM